MNGIGIINGYVDTALSSAHDVHSIFLDLSERYGFEDLDERVQREIRSDVDSFVSWLIEGFEHPTSLCMGEWSVGSNLFLTASRAGTGFWDCGLDEMYHREYSYAEQCWMPWKPCSGEGCTLPEQQPLGAILSREARMYTPPTIEIEHEGQVWMA